MRVVYFNICNPVDSIELSTICLFLENAFLHGSRINNKSDLDKRGRDWDCAFRSNLQKFPVSKVRKMQKQ